LDLDEQGAGSLDPTLTVEASRLFHLKQDGQLELLHAGGSEEKEADKTNLVWFGGCTIEYKQKSPFVVFFPTGQLLKYCQSLTIPYQLLTFLAAIMLG
jgi:hypothetical protein